jgi:error-prone DNA polymerase
VSGPSKATHALRLGFRLVAGLREKDGLAIVKARAEGGPFRSPGDLMRRAKLGPAAMLTLARADAFGSLALGRRETLWEVAALEADAPPLFQEAEAAVKTPPASRTGISARLCRRDNGAGPRPKERRQRIELPALREEEAVAEDYSLFGLSLRNHPMAFMRGEARAKGLVCAADLKGLPNGKPVAIAGLVLFRQRPGTAKGTIFITLEDETGAANLIVWPKISERYRRAVFGAKVLLCEGVMQKESNVIHVVSRRLFDWTAKLSTLQSRAPSNLALRFGRGDEIAHGSGRDARDGVPSWTETLKSRDFR